MSDRARASRVREADAQGSPRRSSQWHALTVARLIALGVPVDGPRVAGFGVFSTYTPLLMSANMGHFAAMKVLVEAGADVTYKAADGKTALAVVRELHQAVPTHVEEMLVAAEMAAQAASHRAAEQAAEALRVDKIVDAVVERLKKLERTELAPLACEPGGVVVPPDTTWVLVPEPDGTFARRVLFHA